ncbi:MAG: hypothetical protein QXV17_08130 [Candidatus Micrarchaeaceae archaeon]
MDKIDMADQEKLASEFKRSLVSGEISLIRIFRHAGFIKIKTWVLWKRGEIKYLVFTQSEDYILSLIKFLAHLIHNEKLKKIPVRHTATNGNLIKPTANSEINKWLNARFVKGQKDV